MAAVIHTSVPDGLIPLLESHLPNSLPILRRLQFTRFPGGQRPTARIILAADGPVISSARNFAAAYLDFGSGIETSLFMYSTLEDNPASSVSVSAADLEVCDAQIGAVVDAVKAVAREQPEHRAYPGRCLVGTLATAVKEAMVRCGVGIEARQEYEYEKWLFRVEDVREVEVELPKGARWERADERDCEVVISRTSIPRQVKTLLTFPSLVLKLEDGTPIAWSFLGTDASLSSLHCEEPYRKRGYAKTLAAKLFKRSTSEYGPDGWYSADVAPDNLGSRGMCKSLGGRHGWNVSWNLLLLDDDK
ncbi:acetyltransferase [Colletotrichum camelliae]|nr:acetyltransferase [Colletotrichum camelliae]